MSVDNDGSKPDLPGAAQEPVKMKLPEIKKPEPVYPIVFEKCPHCGSTRKLGIEAIQLLKDQLLLHKDSFPGGMMLQVPMLDQNHPPKVMSSVVKFKVLSIFYDVCECGTMYCTKFEITDGAIMQQAPPMGPGPGMKRPGVFGKG